LYLARPHLPILGRLLDVGHQLLLLVLELDALAVELALGFLEGALVFAEAFLGGHAFAEGPFYYLGDVSVWKGVWMRAGGVHTFMADRVWWLRVRRVRRKDQS